MARHPKILYWKWDGAIGGKLEQGLADCMARFDFDLLYVSFHHLPLAFGDPALLGYIRRAATALAAKGKGLLLDIDARNETAAFLAQYPAEEGSRVCFWEYPLDGEGRAAFARPNPAPGRTGRRGAPRPPWKLAGLWAFQKTGQGTYLPGTLQAVPPDALGTTPQGDWTAYKISLGEAYAGYTLLAAPVFYAGIPDLFSEHLDRFYAALFDAVGDIPLAGAAADEWGYDTALQCADGLYYVDEFPYTPGLCRRYREAQGRPLDGDLLCFAYAPDGDPGKSLACVNGYLALLRGRVTENNRWFYRETKARFGPRAFVGVHPTLWGDPTDFFADVAHNGLCWWETPRDYAQTDEFVALPIRLALLHKWGGPFYNMWYSGNTQQLDTYWPETWRNLRFGGRTHYLGYECPNEPGVFRLKHPGALEAIDALERKVTEVDRLQRSQPDTRVLILFGMEAVTNWYHNGQAPVLTRGQGLGPQVLRFAAALFEIFLCDLVPTTEVANGSLRFTGATVTYGTQGYDAVLLLAPELADREVLRALGGYAQAGGKLIVAGACAYDNQGQAMDGDFEALAALAAARFKTFPSPLETVALLRGWGVPENRWHNGCVYQDGSLLFTANATQPTGNVLEVDCEHKGRRIRFVGEDYYYVKGS
jgi:hypothetical protein